MPPLNYSRYLFCRGITDTQGKLYLTDRVPFRYRPAEDNRLHTVGKGDSLWTIAAQYFPSFERPAGLYWIIADFQPTPIVDPTIALLEGQQLVIPSERTVREEVFNDSRRAEFSA